MSEGQVEKKRKKKVKKLLKAFSPNAATKDQDAVGLRTLGDAWQDARIRLVAAELVEGLRVNFENILDTRCTLDSENYRLDINDMFKRHNDTATRVTGIEERVLDAERRITMIQNILVRHGLARRVMPV